LRRIASTIASSLTTAADGHEIAASSGVKTARREAADRTTATMAGWIGPGQRQPTGGPSGYWRGVLFGDPPSGCDGAGDLAGGGDRETKGTIGFVHYRHRAACFEISRRAFSVRCFREHRSAIARSEADVKSLMA
jgi:hypothetical protein